jgi:FAD/FMN-containing dehydrogenase
MSNLRARTLASEEITLDDGEIQTLANRLAGQLIRPGDEAYDEARAVWNGMIDRRPALIVRCASSGDVVAAVNFAREHDLLLSVRGGGHNAAGYATNDGGLVIDLGPLNWVQVDPLARIVRVGGGATLGDLDRATQAHGLAVPAGVVSETGVAGLTLSGGYGWLRKKYGLTCDNLLGAEVVTADGRLLWASDRQNRDLFWGLRGGGGNFGVVTTFEFRAYPLGPEVWMTAVFHDGRHAEELLRGWRDYSLGAPDEVATLVAIGHFPPGAEVFPTELHGRPFVAFVGVYAGPAEEGQPAMQPLRDLHPPLVDFGSTTTWIEAQQFFDEDYPAGELRYYWKSANLFELSDAAIEQIVAGALTQPSPLSTTDLWHVGGAIRRVEDDDAAFVGRSAPFLFNVEANWQNAQDDEANVNWARAFVASMSEFSDGSRYFNFPGLHEEGEQIVRDTFGAKHERLVALKDQYDAANLFRMNSNIKPSSKATPRG